MYDNIFSLEDIYAILVLLLSTVSFMSNLFPKFLKVIESLPAFLYKFILKYFAIKSSGNI